MNKKILFAIGAVLLFAGSAAGVFYALNANGNSGDSSQTSESANTTPLTDASAEAERSESTADETQANPNPTPPAVAPSAGSTADPMQSAADDGIVQNIVLSIDASVSSYQANNRGTSPRTQGELDNFTLTYLSNIDRTNPKTVNAIGLSLHMSTPTDDIISYNPGYTCNGDANNPGIRAGTSRQVALLALLPSGKLYCVS